MSKDRMVDYHINRLQDKRESVRLDAIEQLGLLKAVEALGDLETLYHNDPDDDVRRMAKTIGRELYDIKTKSPDS